MALPSLDPIFLPLFPEEDEAKVLADMLAFANEGVSPTEEEWVDVRPGSVIYVAVKPGARKIAQLYDLAGTEVPASAHPLWTWGTYLDDLAAVPGVDRNAATFATGFATFTGPEATEIGAGTRVGVAPPTPDAEAAEFEVTIAGTISGGAVTLPIRAVESGPGGDVGAGEIIEVLTPGLEGVEVTNGSPTLAGTNTETDEAFRVRFLARYGSTQGGGNITDVTNWTLEVDGVGAVSVIPLYAGPGTTLVVPMTLNREAVSDVIVDEVQNLLDPPVYRSVLTADITLPVATIPVETTVGSRPDTDGWLRIGGTEAVSYAAKTGTTFTGAAGGAGAFLAGTEVVQGGQAHGRASPGQHITVRTASGLSVSVEATAEFDDGFSFDGAGGTVPLQDPIIDSVDEYFTTLGVGEEVVQASVQAAIINVRGLHDVSPPLLNGVDGNVAVSTLPPQVAIRGSVSVTPGVLP